MIDYSKFGRNYSLTVQGQDQTYTFAPPFTMEFDITRDSYSTLNVASIRLYNISQIKRNQIRKDIIQYGVRRDVTLRAGYGTNLPTIFSGNVTQCWSVREGNNFITQIESFDGYFSKVNSTINVTFPSNTPKLTIINQFIASMTVAPYPSIITPGAIGSSYGGTIGNNGISISGNPFDEAWIWSGGQFFVDLGKAYFLATNEYYSGQLTEINSASGLIGTPLREGTLVTIDLILTPEVVVGQLIHLTSSTDPTFNGPYKIIGVKHRGIISPVVSGEAITSLRLINSQNSLAQANNK